jgi:lipopolysaccharide transport system permease protein
MAPYTLSPRVLDATDEPLIVIEPRPGWRLVNAGELWRARELMLFLAWRDVTVRYKQTALGAMWAVLQPLAAMLVFTLFLRRVASQADSTVPYGLFVFAGMLPWTFFANSISAAGISLVNERTLITKIYFPRLLVPMSTIVAAFVDFCVGFCVLVVMMVIYKVPPGWNLLALPALVGLLAVAALGVGTLLSSLTVAYRDFRHVLPFLMQIWMFATPSVYLQAQGALGPRAQRVMLFNPAHGLITNFRVAVLGGTFDLGALMSATIISFALLLIGCLYFRRVERTFVDVI